MPPKIFDFGKVFPGAGRAPGEPPSPPGRRHVRKTGAYFPGTAIPMREVVHVYEGDRLVEVIETARQLSVHDAVMEEWVATFRCERAVGMPHDVFVLIAEDHRRIPQSVIADNNGVLPVAPVLPAAPPPARRALEPLTTTRRIVLDG